MNINARFSKQQELKIEENKSSRNVKVPCESREELEPCAGENVGDFSKDSRKSSGKLRKH
jgi:hypothetical protein